MRSLSLPYVRIASLIIASMLSNYRNYQSDAFRMVPTMSRSTARTCSLFSWKALDERPPTKAPNLPKRERPRNVQFLSPLLEYGYRLAVEEYDNGTLAQKPLLLYLPGFDGTFLSPFIQFPELSSMFDIRCMSIPMDDRSTFLELKRSVLHFLQHEIMDSPTPSFSSVTRRDPSISNNATVAPPASIPSRFTSIFGRSITTTSTTDSSGLTGKQRRPVYIAGESFGGILACEIVLTLLEDDSLRNAVNLRGLSLINSATCYDRSRLAALGPTVAEYHPLFYPVGLLQLLPLFADDYSLAQLILVLQAKALPSVIDTAEREAYLGRVALSLPFTIPFMTRETLQWRLQEWLRIGCNELLQSDSNIASVINHRMYTVFQRYAMDLPVLIVAGEHDSALPSIAEAERLAGILPNTRVHVVEGAGHASTCGSRVDLAALFRGCFQDHLRADQTWNGSSSPKSSSSSSFSASLRKSNPHSITTGTAKTPMVGKTWGRIEMKPIAAAGKGEYYGMEPRYDNATSGLSPLRYWNSKFYRKWRQPK